MAGIVRFLVKGAVLAGAIAYFFVWRHDTSAKEARLTGQAKDLLANGLAQLPRLVDAGVLGVPSAPPSASGPAPAPTLVPEVDVPDGLVTTLGCATKTSSACRILRDFASGGSLTDASSAASHTLYFGESFALGVDGEPSADPFFVTLQERRAAARELLTENARERKDASALLDALRTGAPKPESPLVAFMKNASPTDGWHELVASTGASTRLARSTAHLRRKGDRLLVLEYEGGAPLRHAAKGSGASAARGDLGAPARAFVAETWPLD
jgi:hypothetical protein